MARCQADQPCEFYNDVHDYGCPQRAGFYDGELGELYATETAEERAALDAVLEALIDRDLLDTTAYADAEPDDVTGGDPAWLAIRRAIRAGRPAEEIVRAFRLLPLNEDQPELIHPPLCRACGVELLPVLDPTPDQAGTGYWWAHPGPDGPAAPDDLHGHTVSANHPHPAEATR